MWQTPRPGAHSGARNMITALNPQGTVASQQAPAFIRFRAASRAMAPSCRGQRIGTRNGEPGIAGLDMTSAEFLADDS